MAKSKKRILEKNRSNSITLNEGSDKQNSRKSVKILVSYHKKDGLLKNSVLTPINAGRANAVALGKENKPDLPWLLKNTIGDNTGENISPKNSYYNEMTSVYWAWKNMDKLGDPDYIGHFHYRRHLYFKDGKKSVYELGDLGDDYLEQLGFTDERLQELCHNYDLIAPKPQWRKSAYEHFRRNFNIEELDTAIDILKEKFPEYSESADKYLASSGLYFCNIFIMSKELFSEYGNYIFPIMEEFESRIDMTAEGKRMYISEWLTGIFIQRQIDIGKRVTFLPTAVAEAGLTIPVVFASDANYAMQMAVAITSMLKNAKPSTFYDIRCLISEDFGEKNKQKIQSLSNNYHNFKITFKEVNEEIFDNVEIKTAHINKTTLYRLLIADIFPDLDKLVYLDVDLIILDDLSILYRYALDGQYVGGVRAPGYYFPEDWCKDKEKELGISIDQYINAGVLLMNLKKIRKDNMTERFIALANNSYRSEDQDVINVACYGKIRHLPFRFNAQTKYTDPRSQERYKMENLIPEDEIKDALERPVIVHYANPTKPWKEYSTWQSDIWLEYAEISPYADIVKDLRSEKQRLAHKVKVQVDKAKARIHRSLGKIRTIPDNYTKHKGEKYKISIIMPCYNVEDTIEDTLESALIQQANLSPIEIICVDDGSTDNTLQLLCSWAEEFDNIKVFVQSNKGSGHARNVGLEAANGQFVSFLDADDFYPSPTTLENLYCSATKNKQKIAGGCFSTINRGRVSAGYNFPLDGYIFKERKVMSYSDYQFDFGYTRFIYDLKMLHENNIKFPGNRRYQDPPFFIKAMLAAKTFMAVPEQTYRYRISHKVVNWTPQKTTDMMCAIIDILRMSKKENLPKLHFYTYLRFKQHLPPMTEQIRQSNQYAYTLFVDLVRELDFDFMRKADNFDEKLVENMSYADILRSTIPQDNAWSASIAEINTRLCILEKVTFLQRRNEELERELRDRSSISDQQGETEALKQYIEDIMHSWTWRVGRIVTFVPRKIKGLFVKNR